MKFVCALAIFGLVASCQGRYRALDERISVALLARDFNPSIQNDFGLRIYQWRIKANMNDYVDRMLKNAASFMEEHGYDPMQLPDLTKPFEFTDLVGIEWHGEIDLTKGWLQDLSTIYRSGDVTVEYEDGKMVIKADMAFKDLTFDYDFLAKFMKLSKDGEVDGVTSDVKVYFSADVDLGANKIELVDFKITHVTDADVKFEGLGVVGDFVVDALNKVILQLFNEEILKQVETEARKVIEDALAHTDIGDIINNTIMH